MTPQGQETLKAELRLDEGLRLHAYQDGGGVWTIGYGHTGPEVRAGLVWTVLEAEIAFTRDIEHAEYLLSKYLPWWERLDDPQADVLADMAFNLGISGILKWKHFLASLEAGNDNQAGADLLASHPWVDQVGDRAQRLARQVETNTHQPAWANAATKAALA